MSDHAFDTFTRRATDVVSRRNSLLTLGGAALAATIAMPAKTSAKKGNGKDRCKSQVEKCKNGVFDLCFEVYGEDAGDCTSLFSPCCEFLNDCKAAQAFECAVEKLDGLIVKA